MPKITPALWAKLTVIFTALVGAFLAGAQDYALAAHPGLDLKHVALGAGLAGLAAAWHRYQPPPPPKPAVDPNVVNGALLLAVLFAVNMAAIVVFVPACGLTAADAGKVAGCSGAYDACFIAARAKEGTKEEKSALYLACRSQVDAKCLDVLVPPPPAPTVAAIASATPSATATTAPTTAPVASIAPQPTVSGLSVPPSVAPPAPAASASP